MALISIIWTILSLSSTFQLVQGASDTPVPSPDLDFSSLGQVSLAGDFDAISLYTYEGQTELGSGNGSQSLLSQMPNGDYATLAAADADIQAMCAFVQKDGTLAGVVVGGNFTSLGGIEAQGVALYNPKTMQVSPLDGLSGQVAALYCEQDTNTVYVGGDFRGANSTNAIAWVAGSQWTNLPFAGFNGPVSSITKAPNGHIVFGGSFDGLGNTTTPKKRDQQVINIAGASLSSGGSTPQAGFGDPANIACGSDGTSGAGKTWLLADDRTGFWRADMGFGYNPTKLRIWNTNQDGRGTKTFLFRALPIDGIMNLTYTDTDGSNKTCDSRCPLPQNTEYQDFHFVNVIGMNAFQIDISAWYGDGAGLNGIQLFEDNMFAYAINSFNEPTCANITLGSNSTTTGSWSQVPSGSSSADYLSIQLDPSTASVGSSEVVFMPDIKQAGNYSVTMYTPGCTDDNTCGNRGIVNITATYVQGVEASPTTVYQTNNYDKYDQIYYGYVDSNSDSFRPSVTLTPASGQSGDLTFVASRVQWQVTNTTGGLNGLFEFNQNMAMVNSDFSTSAINQAGIDLNEDAQIKALSVIGDTMYVGGNFSDNTVHNIFAFSDGQPNSLPDGGLNGGVLSLLDNDNILYVGGMFTGTTSPGPQGLSYVASYSPSQKAWNTLGAGVNGPVTSVETLSLNITANKPETVIALSGDFDQINAFGGNQAIQTQGLAVWVLSRDNWLQNLDLNTPSLRGQVTSTVNVPNNGQLIAGTLSSDGISMSDVAALSTSGTQSINSIPVKIQAQAASSSSQKRATSGQNVTGAAAIEFYQSGNLNVTVIGGHFTAQATDGSTINNLLFLNGSNKDAVTGLPKGLDSDSTFMAMTTHNNILFAGGSVTGSFGGSSVDGLVLYDLQQASFVATQPPALGGDNVVVYDITSRPGTGEIYVGGNFDSAGSLGCAGLCMFDTTASQWSPVGSVLDGSVTGMAWASKNKLIAGGNLTINGASTPVATYDAKKQKWSSLGTAGQDIPGPVTALTPGNSDASEIWVAGTANNGSAFLMKYDGKKWNSAGNALGTQSTIRGIQILMLNKDHSNTNLVDSDQALLLTGQLTLPQYGAASAALFNGTDFTPFIFSTSNGKSGSIARLFSSNQNMFKSKGKR